MPIGGVSKGAASGEVSFNARKAALAIVEQALSGPRTPTGTVGSIPVNEAVERAARAIEVLEAALLEARRKERTS